MRAIQPDLAEIQGAVKLDASGNRAIWDENQRLQLTYCVQQFPQQGDFPRTSLTDRQVTTLKLELNSATAAWEDYANVDFIDVGGFSQTCEEVSTPTLFRIAAGPSLATGGIPGVAFFPDSPEFQRVVRISVTCIEGGGCDLINSTISLSGLVRHELGHVLGLVHEHIRVSNCDGIAVQVGRLREHHDI